MERPRTAEQEDMGCKRVQGYYFSRPLPADELTDRMEKDLHAAPCPI